MFNIPDPSCTNECRFTLGVSITTAMYYPPVYDKHGNNLNPDMNTTTCDVSCSVCGRSWVSSTVLGKTDYREIKKDCTIPTDCV